MNLSSSSSYPWKFETDVSLEILDDLIFLGSIHSFKRLKILLDLNMKLLVTQGSQDVFTNKLGLCLQKKNLSLSHKANLLFITFYYLSKYFHDSCEPTNIFSTHFCYISQILFELTANADDGSPKLRLFKALFKSIRDLPLSSIITSAFFGDNKILAAVRSMAHLEGVPIFSLVLLFTDGPIEDEHTRMKIDDQLFPLLSHFCEQIFSTSHQNISKTLLLVFIKSVSLRHYFAQFWESVNKILNKYSLRSQLNTILVLASVINGFTKSSVSSEQFMYLWETCLKSYFMSTSFTSPFKSSSSEVRKIASSIIGSLLQGSNSLSIVLDLKMHIFAPSMSPHSNFSIEGKLSMIQGFYIHWSSIVDEIVKVLIQPLICPETKIPESIVYAIFSLFVFWYETGNPIPDSLQCFLLKLIEENNEPAIIAYATLSVFASMRHISLNWKQIPVSSTPLAISLIILNCTFSEPSDINTIEKLLKAPLFTKTDFIKNFTDWQIRLPSKSHIPPFLVIGLLSKLACDYPQANFIVRRFFPLLTSFLHSYPEECMKFGRALCGNLSNTTGEAVLLENFKSTNFFQFCGRASLFSFIAGILHHPNCGYHPTLLCDFLLEELFKISATSKKADLSSWITLVVSKLGIETVKYWLKEHFDFFKDLICTVSRLTRFLVKFLTDRSFFDPLHINSFCSIFFLERPVDESIEIFKHFPDLSEIPSPNILFSFYCRVAQIQPKSFISLLSKSAKFSSWSKSSIIDDWVKTVSEDSNCHTPEIINGVHLMIAFLWNVSEDASDGLLLVRLMHLLHTIMTASLSRCSSPLWGRKEARTCMVPLSVSAIMTLINKLSEQKFEFSFPPDTEEFFLQLFSVIPIDQYAQIIDECSALALKHLGSDNRLFALLVLHLLVGIVRAKPDVKFSKVLHLLVYSCSFEQSEDSFDYLLCERDVLSQDIESCPTASPRPDPVLLASLIASTARILFSMLPVTPSELSPLLLSTWKAKFHAIHDDRRGGGGGGGGGTLFPDNANGPFVDASQDIIIGLSNKFVEHNVVMALSTVLLLFPSETSTPAVIIEYVRETYKGLLQPYQQASIHLRHRYEIELHHQVKSRLALISLLDSFWRVYNDLLKDPESSSYNLHSISWCFKTLWEPFYLLIIEDVFPWEPSRLTLEKISQLGSWVVRTIIAASQGPKDKMDFHVFIEEAIYSFLKNEELQSDSEKAPRFVQLLEWALLAGDGSDGNDGSDGSDQLLAAQKGVFATQLLYLPIIPKDFTTGAARLLSSVPLDAWKATTGNNGLLHSNEYAESAFLTAQLIRGALPLSAISHPNWSFFDALVNVAQERCVEGPFAFLFITSLPSLFDTHSKESKEITIKWAQFLASHGHIIYQGLFIDFLVSILSAEPTTKGGDNTKILILALHSLLPVITSQAMAGRLQHVIRAICSRKILGTAHKGLQEATVYLLQAFSIDSLDELSKEIIASMTAGPTALPAIINSLVMGRIFLRPLSRPSIILITILLRNALSGSSSLTQFLNAEGRRKLALLVSLMPLLIEHKIDLDFLIEMLTDPMLTVIIHHEVVVANRVAMARALATFTLAMSSRSSPAASSSTPLLNSMPIEKRLVTELRTGGSHAMMGSAVALSWILLVQGWSSGSIDQILETKLNIEWLPFAGSDPYILVLLESIVTCFGLFYLPFIPKTLTTLFGANVDLGALQRLVMSVVDLFAKYDWVAIDFIHNAISICSDKICNNDDGDDRRGAALSSYLCLHAPQYLLGSFAWLVASSRPGPLQFLALGAINHWMELRGSDAARLLKQTLVDFSVGMLLLDLPPNDTTSQSSSPLQTQTASNLMPESPSMYERFLSALFCIRLLPGLGAPRTQALVLWKALVPNTPKQVASLVVPILRFMAKAEAAFFPSDNELEYHPEVGGEIADLFSKYGEFMTPDLLSLAIQDTDSISKSTIISMALQYIPIYAKAIASAILTDKNQDSDNVSVRIFRILLDNSESLSQTKVWSRISRVLLACSSGGGSGSGSGGSGGGSPLKALNWLLLQISDLLDDSNRMLMLLASVAAVEAMKLHVGAKLRLPLVAAWASWAASLKGDAQVIIAHAVTRLLDRYSDVGEVFIFDKAFLLLLQDVPTSILKVTLIPLLIRPLPFLSHPSLATCGCLRCGRSSLSLLMNQLIKNQLWMPLLVLLEHLASPNYDDFTVLHPGLLIDFLLWIVASVGGSADPPIGKEFKKVAANMAAKLSNAIVTLLVSMNNPSAIETTAGGGGSCECPCIAQDDGPCTRGVLVVYHRLSSLTIHGIISADVAMTIVPLFLSGMLLSPFAGSTERLSGIHGLSWLLRVSGGIGHLVQGSTMTLSPMLTIAGPLTRVLGEKLSPDVAAPLLELVVDGLLVSSPLISSLRVFSTQLFRSFLRWIQSEAPLLLHEDEFPPHDFSVLIVEKAAKGLALIAPLIPALARFQALAELRPVLSKLPSAVATELVHQLNQQ